MDLALPNRSCALFSAGAAACAAVLEFLRHTRLTLGSSLRLSGMIPSRQDLTVLSRYHCKGTMFVNPGSRRRNPPDHHLKNVGQLITPVAWDR